MPAATLLDPTLPDVAYLIGLLQTDGAHEGSLTGKGRVALELSARDDHVLYALSARLPFYTSVGHRTRDTNFRSGYASSVLRIYDQDARRDLSRLGVPTGRKSRSICPPPVPFHRSAYLRGLLDGDGSVGFTATGKPFVSFSTAARPVAEFFCSCVLEVCGVSRTLSRNARDEQYNPMVANVAAAKLAAWVWPSTHALGIERKWASAQAVAAWSPPANREGRFGVARRAWTDQEDQVVLSMSDAAAAERLGRSTQSIRTRRWRLHKGHG
jgi:hypothetical protein